MLCVLRLRTKAPNAVRATYCSNAPNTKSLKSLKNAAMEIQKQLIQQTKKWPLESGREDRSLKHDLLTRLEKQQTELNDSSDPKQVLELGQQAQDELVAITDLLTNKHFKKVLLTQLSLTFVAQIRSLRCSRCSGETRETSLKQISKKNEEQTVGNIRPLLDLVFR